MSDGNQQAVTEPKPGEVWYEWRGGEMRCYYRCTDGYDQLLWVDRDAAERGGQGDDTLTRRGLSEWQASLLGSVFFAGASLGALAFGLPVVQGAAIGLAAVFSLYTLAAFARS